MNAEWTEEQTKDIAELAYEHRWMTRPDWRDTIDRNAERAKREVKAMAQTARRSLGQRIRHDRAEVRRMCA